MHLGSSSFPGVAQPSAVQCSWWSGTTELLGSDGGGSLWQRVGAERSTAAQISSVCFSGRFNLSSEVVLRKYAVRVGDSSRLRGWGGVSRGAENVLRTEESTLEKQVSFGGEDSYFPRFGAFGVWVIIGVHIFQMLSRVRACASLLRRCWPFLELVPVKWLLVPRCYPVGIIMQHLGVVLSTSTSNISMWNSTLVTPRSGWCAFSLYSYFSAPAPETFCGADDLSDVSVQCFSHICCFYVLIQLRWGQVDQFWTLLVEKVRKIVIQ